MLKKRGLSSFVIGIIAAVVLLAISWRPLPVFNLLIFIAVVPLLFLTQWLSELRKFIWISSFITYFLVILLWQGLTVSWMGQVSNQIYLIAAALNPLHYALPLSFVPLVWKKRGEVTGVLFFIVLFLTIEWIVQYSPLASPFFLLGYTLGDIPQVIQHYRWIGIEGGSLWILSVNGIIYLMLRRGLSYSRVITLILACFFLPISASLSIPSFDRTDLNVAMLHSQRNSYAKDAVKEPSKEMHSLLNNFRNCRSGVDLYILPETSIVNFGWLHHVDDQSASREARKFVDSTNSTLIFGAIGFYPAGQKSKKAYVSCDEQEEFCYTTHNVSVNIGANKRTQLISKELFIPFQEQIPLLQTFPWIENWIEHVGMRSLYSPMKNGVTSFNTSCGRLVSVLCYESIYPLFMSIRSKQVDGPTVILTNEKWMIGDIGVRQYNRTVTPLAIQTGKSIIRCSNSGTSSVTLPNGEVIAFSSGENENVLTAAIPSTYKETFYLSISGAFYSISIIMVLLIIFFSIIKTKQLSL